MFKINSKKQASISWRQKKVDAKFIFSADMLAYGKNTHIGIQK